MLEMKKVKASYTNMEALGFGRGTYSLYKTGKRSYEPTAVTDRIKDRALQVDGPKTTADLAVGSKVIAVTNEKATRTRRDRLSNAISRCLALKT